jgi:hypothetical protein
MPLFEIASGGNPGVMTRTQAPLLIAVADDPLRFEPRRQRPWDGLLAQARSLTLDAQLAAGAAADTDKLRQVRARQLTSPRRRRKLATCWDELLGRCTGGTANAARGAAVPVQQSQIVAVAPQIRALTSRLRGRLPVAAQAVAMASLLLTDGRGPVYNRSGAPTLYRSLLDTLDRLDPATPVRLS